VGPAALASSRYPIEEIVGIERQVQRVTGDAIIVDGGIDEVISRQIVIHVKPGWWTSPFSHHLPDVSSFTAARAEVLIDDSSSRDAAPKSLGAPTVC
jgi:hypothetical protein